MWTRSRAREANQPVFIDNNWNDLYIQTKDEQIALLQSKTVLEDWNDDIDDDTSLDSDSDSEESSGHADPRQRTPSKLATPSMTITNILTRLSNEIKNCATYWSWNIMLLTVVPFICHYIIQRCIGRGQRYLWPFSKSTLTVMVCTLLSNLFVIISLVLVTCHIFCLLPEMFIKNRFNSYRSISEVTQMAKMQDFQQYFKCVQSFLLKQSLPILLQDIVNRDAFYSSDQILLISQWLTLVSGLAIVLVSYHRSIRRLAAVILPVWILITMYDDYIHRIHTSAVIHAIDPIVAFKNEAIIIDIDGDNLEETGLIHWVPYWNSHESKLVMKFTPTLTSILTDGSVLVSFNSVNDHFPCYESPKTDRNHLKEHETLSNKTSQYVCFEHLRVRVKDIRSIPGWSLDDKHASILSTAMDGL
uniref:Uncharacterized protein AlNc14C195G8540 n=1 Tax=Albugo laibachii Nc14 TaxID=890382 RepID=F0WQ59_9STRA|nr:conserved hypothetical protein [Albugo laibachii Nc14]|eukprot:CCA23465.1 conserved hypothetical protein [Albugo laibachii Nc14]